ncbi:ABC transporter permease [Nocardia bovistercoris]|uniref:ABC transporter permease n=1 Tax=Nocardia bovistercoris TaxID=2785916 RepID=A0A931IE94_9NOCA|nr:ABC transporter permease [Nocardia bovistercoris]MBH0780087.1 ABC transporter permease [Nocardia bovistercoris]
MARYLALRVLQAIWVLWAAFTISFVVLYLLPADPVSIAADAGGAGTPVDKAAVAELQARYGLDRPLWEQYCTALGHAVRGDLGHSISSGQTVTGAIGDAAPDTLALAGLALLFAVLGGVALAFAATYTRRPWLRDTLAGLPSLGVAVPTFWTGLLLLQLFSFHWRLVPAFGGRGFAGTVLPALTLAIPIGAVLAQVLSAGLESTWRQPFVDVARAKGGSRLWVQRTHVLRPASVPTFTIAGVLVGNMLAGSVVVETVFARPGLGRITQASVLSQDIPVVQGIVLVTALVFVTVNLAVDLLYPLLDPRIAGRARGGGFTGVEKDAEAEKGAGGEFESDARAEASAGVVEVGSRG